jgi:hypothetical protein
LDHLDTDYDVLEERFASQIESKAVEIEQLEPQELEDLKRLEKQLKRVEKEKLSLLKREFESEKALLLASGGRALDLQEIESRFELRTRERERALTKLYGRLNSKIRE